MICERLERDVPAYVDRELDATAAAAMRAHLRDCAECRRHVAELETLGRLVRAIPQYTAPERLRSRVAASVVRTRSTNRLLMSLAAAAVLVLAIGGVTVLRPRAPQRDTIVEEVVGGHVRSLMAEHLFDVQSTDQHTVKPWFLGRLDFSPPVTDFATIGFPLVGGRLDYLDGRPVAALVYQRQKHTINVFVMPKEGDSSDRLDAQSVKGFHVLHWVRNGMAFWAVSDLNEVELRAFATAMQTS